MNLLMRLRPSNYHDENEDSILHSRLGGIAFLKLKGTEIVRTFTLKNYYVFVALQTEVKSYAIKV